MDAHEKIAGMKHLAEAKVAAAGDERALIRAVEEKLNLIAYAAITNMAPINENLLGLSFILLAAVKRRP